MKTLDTDKERILAEIHFGLADHVFNQTKELCAELEQELSQGNPRNWRALDNSFSTPPVVAPGSSTLSENTLRPAATHFSEMNQIFITLQSGWQAELQFSKNGASSNGTSAEITEARLFFVDPEGTRLEAPASSAVRLVQKAREKM